MTEVCRAPLVSAITSLCALRTASGVRTGRVAFDAAHCGRPTSPIAGAPAGIPRDDLARPFGQAFWKGPMSVVGQSRPRLPTPAPTDVRSYSNNDQNDAARRMTRSANSRRHASSLRVLLHDDFTHLAARTKPPSLGLTVGLWPLRSAAVFSSVSGIDRGSARRRAPLPAFLAQTTIAPSVIKDRLSRVLTIGFIARSLFLPSLCEAPAGSSSPHAGGRSVMVARLRRGWRVLTSLWQKLASAHLNGRPHIQCQPTGLVHSTVRRNVWPTSRPRGAPSPPYSRGQLFGGSATGASGRLTVAEAKFKSPRMQRDS